MFPRGTGGIGWIKYKLKFTIAKCQTTTKFIFALTHCQIQLANSINYNSKTGLAHWKAATAPLRKDSEMYDCTPDGFHQFIKSIRVRADSYG